MIGDPQCTGSPTDPCQVMIAGRVGPAVRDEWILKPYIPDHWTPCTSAPGGCITQDKNIIWGPTPIRGSLADNHYLVGSRVYGASPREADGQEWGDMSIQIKTIAQKCPQLSVELNNRRVARAIYTSDMSGSNYDGLWDRDTETVTIARDKFWTSQEKDGYVVLKEPVRLRAALAEEAMHDWWGKTATEGTAAKETLLRYCLGDVVYEPAVFTTRRLRRLKA